MAPEVAGSSPVFHPRVCEFSFETKFLYLTMKKSVKENLSLLGKLQSVDSQLYQIVELRGDLPLEIVKLNDNYSIAQQNLIEKEKNLEDAHAVIKLQKEIIKDKNFTLTRYEKQKEETSNSREYDAVVKAIELYHLDIQIAEKKIKSSLNAIDFLIPEIQKSKQDLDKMKSTIEAKESELKVLISEKDLIERELTEERKSLIKNIDPSVLSTYDKVRMKMRNGLAAVKISRGACSACFMLVPVQKQIDVSVKLAIEKCDYCGATFLDAPIEMIPETGIYTSGFRNSATD